MRKYKDYLAIRHDGQELEHGLSTAIHHFAQEVTMKSRDNGISNVIWAPTPQRSAASHTRTLDRVAWDTADNLVLALETATINAKFHVECIKHAESRFLTEVRVGP